MESMLQLETFQRTEGCFGSWRALALRNKFPAYQWWGAHACEEEAGELRSVAIKVSSAPL